MHIIEDFLIKINEYQLILGKNQTPEQILMDSANNGIYNQLKILKFRDYSDLDYLNLAIDSLTFIASEKESLLQYLKIPGLFLALCAKSIYALSDEFKNRQSIFLKDFSWFHFDFIFMLTAELSNNPLEVLECKIKHFKFTRLMVEKIIREDVDRLLKFLKNIHSIECIKNNLPIIYNDTDGALLKEIYKQQNIIDQKIKISLDYSAEQEQLLKMLRNESLLVELPHTKFLCSTVKDHFSLSKIIALIDKAQKFVTLTSMEEKCAFLNILVQIGENMTHKKLSASLKEQFPKIPWAIYEDIRNHLQHVNKSRRYEVLFDLTSDKLKENISVDQLNQELTTLKNAISDIVNIKYPSVEESFISAYKNKYESIAQLSDQDKDQVSRCFEQYRSQIEKDSGISTRFEEIISGKGSFFSKTELTKIYKLIPEPSINNKQIREDCEQNIKDLNTENNDREKTLEFLLENLHLDQSDQEHFITSLKERANDKDITKNEMKKLRGFIPHELRNIDESMKKVNFITTLEELYEACNKGNHLLAPSKLSMFKKTSTFLTKEAAWTQTLCFNQPFTLELFYQLTTDIDHTQDAATKDIFRRLLVTTEQYFDSLALEKLSSEDLSRFRQIIAINSEISSIWKKFLTNETPVPEQSVVHSHVHQINSNNSSDCKDFVRLVSTLRPITVNTTKKLRQIFQDKNDPALNLNNDELVLFFHNYLKATEDYLLRQVVTEDFWQKMIEAQLPAIFEYADQEINKNPTLQQYTAFQQRCYQQVANETKRTGKAVTLPTEELSAVFSMMGLDKIGNDPMFMDNSSKQVEQALEDEYNTQVPTLLKDNLIFTHAMEFNLTIIFALLKDIIKFPAMANAEFINENYIALKKCRNQLAHGDYHNEAIKIDNNAIIKTMLDSINVITEEIAKIFDLKSLEKKYPHINSSLFMMQCKEDVSQNNTKMRLTK